LFYAILRVAGVVTLAVIGAALVGALLFFTARWMIARGRKR
jgi:HAMP domain-containing protein